MADVLTDDRSKVAFVVDQHAVGALGALGAWSAHAGFGQVIEILAAAERPFIRHRRWHARGPGDEET